MEKTELIKAIKSFIGDRVYYDEYGGGYIWGVVGKREVVQMIAQVEDVEEENAVVNIRGWGAIQNLKNLPCSPDQFQDELGKFIAEAINEKLECNGSC
jgi:hypothetical protein